MPFRFNPRSGLYEEITREEADDYYSSMPDIQYSDLYDSEGQLKDTSWQIGDNNLLNQQGVVVQTGGIDRGDGTPVTSIVAQDPITIMDDESRSTYDKIYQSIDFNTEPDPITTQSHIDVTNNQTFTDPQQEQEITTAGIDLPSWYDTFFSAMPPFSLFPGGSLFEFFQGIFDKDNSKPDTPAEGLGQNIGNTLDLFSNPIMLLILIMGMRGGGRNSMSSMLPLLLLLPMLTNTIKGGDPV